MREVVLRNVSDEADVLLKKNLLEDVMLAPLVLLRSRQLVLSQTSRLDQSAQ